MDFNEHLQPPEHAAHETAGKGVEQRPEGELAIWMYGADDPTHLAVLSDI